MRIPGLAHSALLPDAPVIVRERLLRGWRHHRQEVLHFQHSFLPVDRTPVSTFSLLASLSCLPQCVTAGRNDRCPCTHKQADYWLAKKGAGQAPSNCGVPARAWTARA
jgi:hypothetical protein